MTLHLIETLEEALSRLVQQVKTGETHLIEFARGDWEKIKDALTGARAAQAAPVAVVAPAPAPGQATADAAYAAGQVPAEAPIPDPVPVAVSEATPAPAPVSDAVPTTVPGELPPVGGQS